MILNRRKEHRRSNGGLYGSKIEIPLLMRINLNIVKFRIEREVSNE